jgi:hypothetical protein
MADSTHRRIELTERGSPRRAVVHAVALSLVFAALGAAVGLGAGSVAPAVDLDVGADGPALTYKYVESTIGPAAIADGGSERPVAYLVSGAVGAGVGTAAGVAASTVGGPILGGVVGGSAGSFAAA